jgi:transcription termination factor NusB
LFKVSQELLNPDVVAKQIAEIIKTMISQMKPDSQLKAIPNIKDKIKDLSVSELSSKKVPGGAPIGTSISLIKNILNGKDPAFIYAVVLKLGEFL